MFNPWEDEFGKNNEIVYEIINDNPTKLSLSDYHCYGKQWKIFQEFNLLV